MLEGQRREHLQSLRDLNSLLEANGKGQRRVLRQFAELSTLYAAATRSSH